MSPKTAAAPSCAAASASAHPSGAATAASSSAASSSGTMAALAASGVTRARQVASDIDELLVAQKRAREENAAWQPN